MRGLSLTAEDLTDLMAGNSINVEDENGYELLVTPDQAPSTTVGPYPRDAVEFEETDEGVMWFINEDGGVYPYPAHRQERDFPNDDHVAYPDGEAARDAVDLSEVDVSVNVSVVIGCRSFPPWKRCRCRRST